MESTPKVSILVPVYNVARFLRQCLDSLVNQTLKDIEIIVINDGSTDESPQIIREYAAKDPRIVFIDKENEGYGKSMNRGLDAATGEYIGIVESDDWVDADMYEDLYELAVKNDTEIIRTEYYEYTSTPKEQSCRIRPRNEVLSRDCENGPKELVGAMSG